MRIQLKTKFKSVPAALDFVLPSFCVLTGKNGSGKSHLLEAIANANAAAVTINGVVAQNISYVAYNGLNPQISERSDSQQVINGIATFWGQTHEIISQYKSAVSSGANYDKETEISSFFRYGVHQYKTIIPALTQILRKTGKRLEDLNQEDISNNLSFSQIASDQIFFSQCALIFKAYHSRLIKNEIAEFRASKHGSSTIPFLTSEEFTDKFGPPPWELINEILLRAGLPYQVTSPEGVDYELPYNLRLVDARQGIEISVNDLSSGEKVLMSLALAIYNTSAGGMKPDLLLLDEPDAPLHPQFSKLLIEVIIETIVARAGVNVIITTHSPSTVAMAPFGSVFEIGREAKNPQLVSNARAIEILTEGISYLKVSYNERRQVFVESKYDVQYFERLYNIFSRKYVFEYQPVFLEPHTGTSNCSDVISIVEKLRASGSDLAYGIIDYDNTNQSKDCISVLGGGIRYAVENYILDPLYIALAMIRHGKKNFSDFGVTGKSTYMDAFNLSQSESQTIVDSVLRRAAISLNDLSPTIFENGFIVNYPKDFLLCQGHEYERKISAAFVELNSISRGQGDSALKLGVLQVVEELPQFLPSEIAKTFASVLGIKE